MGLHLQLEVRDNLSSNVNLFLLTEIEFWFCGNINAAFSILSPFVNTLYICAVYCNNNVYMWLSRIKLQAGVLLSHF